NIASAYHTPGLFFEAFDALRRSFVINKKIKPVGGIDQIHKASISDVVFTGEDTHKKPQYAR
ncbi:MAG: hypothetical protein WBB64_08715, partial [Anaerolineales bacterium]